MNYIKELQELALGSRLKQLSDLIMADGKRIYSDSGIDFDPTWFPVFKLLSEGTPLGVVEIAENLGVSHPHVVNVVRALEKRGLVVNEANVSDARKRAITLSESGKEMLPELRSLWLDIENAIKQLVNECRNNLLMSLEEVETNLKTNSLYDRFETAHKNRLMSAVEIVSYAPEMAVDFKLLNLEWLEKFFSVEPIDEKVLGDPQTHIIDKGGDILFALLEGKVVGTCALVKKTSDRFELSKMAVTENVQGLQIGKKLGLAIVELAKSRGASVLFLESNRRLLPALALYRRLGFVEMPSPDITSDYKRSDIYMELRFKKSTS